MIEGCGTLFVFKLNANMVMRKTFSKGKYVYNKKIKNRKDFQV